MPDANDPSLPPVSRTRTRILETALRRFARHGRNGVTMREIALDTGLTMPTLYHHFGDKDGLYDACAASVIAAAAQSLQHAVDRAVDARTRVQAFAATLCELLLNDPTLLAFLQMETIDGFARLAALVPAELLDEVDAATQSAPARREPLTRARRLLAYAVGCAVVWRSGCAAGRLDVAALAALLVAASDVTGGAPDRATARDASPAAPRGSRSPDKRR